MVALHQLGLDEVQLDTDRLGGEPHGAAWSGSGQVVEVNGHVAGLVGMLWKALRRCG